MRMRNMPVVLSMVVVPVALQAAVITIYDGATGNIATDTAAFNTSQDFGDGTTFSVENVPAATPFGTGNAMRMYDNNGDDKPELQGETAAALTGAFRVDFMAYNQATAGTSKAMRFRMANSGDSITSESRSAFSLSWQADGKVTAKYSDGGLNDGNAGDVDTKSSDPLLNQVISITLIGNNSTADSYGYSLFAETRSLNPQSYDVYIDGVLLNSGSDEWYANGMKYTLEKSADNYDPALGIQRFGILGSSNADMGSDVLFDDIILRTGTDVIPEPATFGLVGLFGGAFLFIRRRMKR